MEKQELLNLAAFNKLKLSPAEETQLSADLDFALQSLGKMREIDTHDVPPLVHCVDFVNVFRADAVHKTVSREEILANAPKQSEGCFQVPKVLE